MRCCVLLAVKNQKAGIGIIAKNTPAIDIDTLDEVMSQHMIEWIRDNIDDAPLRYGKAPKALMMFTTEKPFRKITSALYRRNNGPLNGERVEILGDGQQFVSDHIHPDTGKPYYWPIDGQNPIDVSVFDLPTLNEEQAKACCREFERMADELGWERISEGSAAAPEALDAKDYDALAEVLPPDETPEEVERVKSALEAMKPNSSDYDYDSWRNILFALKWTKWQCAEDLAREFSESSDKHNAKEFRTVWKGAQKRLRGKEYTLATIYHMAKAQGWDSSRVAMSEADREELLEALIDEAEGLITIEKQGRAIKDLMRKVAEAKLDPVDEGGIIKAVKNATSESVTDLRMMLRQYKSDNADATATTHAGYAKAFLAKLEDAAGIEPVGVEGMIYNYSKRKGVWDGMAAPDGAAVKVANEFDGQENCERRGDYTSIENHAYSVAAQDNEDFFNNAPVGLACQGRFYSVNVDGEIAKEPIGPEHRQRVLSPVRPVAGDMPLFEKFLHETFDGDCEEDQTTLLQEVIGAALVGTMARYEKAVLFKGAGRAGKGTLMKIIEAMMPPEWRSAITPFKWDNEYYLAAMAGKRLNLVGELPDDVPIPAATFKTVTGRDTLQGRHPGGRPFNFRNQAAHIFNTNFFPHTKDHSEAFFSRWILIEFRNSRIGTEQIETDLARRIIENELAQIMAWALKGARRLQARDRFEVNAVQHRMMAQWGRRTSSLAEFVLDPDACIVTGSKYDTCSRAEFYKHYVSWCKDSNRFAMGKIKAFDEMEGNLFGRMGVHIGTTHNHQYVVRGVKVRKSDWEVFEEDDQEL